MSDNTTTNLRGVLVDLVAEKLAGTYHCGRVWQAWSYGTMGPDDFSPVEESDTPGEIADAVVLKLQELARAATAEVWQARVVLANGPKFEWTVVSGSGDGEHGREKAAMLAELKRPDGSPSFEIRGLYAHPPLPSEPAEDVDALKWELERATEALAAERATAAQLRAQLDAALKLCNTLKGRKPLTDAQIEAGRHETFSTGNPFCPCTGKTMLKAVRWAEAAHGIGGLTP